MELTLRVSEFTVYDLQESYQWYEKKQAGLGSTFLSEYEKAQSLILSNPFHYQKKYQQLRHCRLKRFPFSIYFLVNEKYISIVAVYHASRAFRQLFSRLG